MVQIDIEYLGDLHCKAVHEPSKTVLFTDAPVDNGGKAEFFSPTDLLATAAGTCMSTIMGIAAQKHNIDIKGMKIKVLKEMTSIPNRRVGKLTFDITFPHKLEDKDFQILKNIVRTCPVIRSIHPDLEIESSFGFAE